MANLTVRGATRNQITGDYNYQNTFLFDNRFLSGQAILNNTGAEYTIVEGEVLGRIAASGKLVPLVKAATDGSQYPVGIYMGSDLTLAIAGEDVCTICISGGVNENAITLLSGTTLADPIELKTLRDRIASDTAGVILTVSDELSNYDN